MAHPIAASAPRVTVRTVAAADETGARRRRHAVCKEREEASMKPRLAWGSAAALDAATAAINAAAAPDIARMRSSAAAAGNASIPPLSLLCGAPEMRSLTWRCAAAAELAQRYQQTPLKA
jgi:hypothetical protein